MTRKQNKTSWYRRGMTVNQCAQRVFGYLTFLLWHKGWYQSGLSQPDMVELETAAQTAVGLEMPIARIYLTPFVQVALQRLSSHTLPPHQVLQLLLFVVGKKDNVDPPSQYGYGGSVLSQPFCYGVSQLQALLGSNISQPTSHSAASPSPGQKGAAFSSHRRLIPSPSLFSSTRLWTKPKSTQTQLKYIISTVLCSPAQPASPLAFPAQTFGKSFATRAPTKINGTSMEAVTCKKMLAPASCGKGTQLSASTPLVVERCFRLHEPQPGWRHLI